MLGVRAPRGTRGLGNEKLLESFNLALKSSLDIFPDFNLFALTQAPSRSHTRALNSSEINILLWDNFGFIEKLQKYCRDEFLIAGRLS